MNYHPALVQLPLVREGRQRITTPADAYQLCIDIADLAQETFHILCLNAKNGLINRHLVSLGLVDASLVHSREVFRPAIEDSSSNIVLVHNHPSGECTPSGEDIRITTKLIEAGKIVDIRILDHVIVGRPVDAVGEQPGRPGFVSLRESGLCAFG